MKTIWLLEINHRFGSDLYAHATERGTEKMDAWFAGRRMAYEAVLELIKFKQRK